MASSHRLGDHDEFSSWTLKPRSWGPDGEWRADFAGAVVDGLTAGIRAFHDELAARYPSKAEAVPVAVGCVPWFTSAAVALALRDLGGHTLVVVNKGSGVSDAVQRILEADAQGDGLAFLQRIFDGLSDFGPPDGDGRAPVVHPSGAMPGDRLIGPLRSAGWREGPRATPLLHTKLLVLGAWWRWDGDHGEELEYFTPMKVWMGSANWTEGSRKHLEFGAWCDDADLTAASAGFLEDLVRFSEPFDTTTTGPEPELVAGVWDDSAFAEAAAEMLDAYEELDEDA